MVKGEQNNRRDTCFTLVSCGDVMLMCNAVMFDLLLATQQMENAEAERDIYDELLTQAEIQGNVNKVNGKTRKHTRAHVYSPICSFVLGFHGAVLKCKPLSCSGHRPECSRASVAERR